MTLQSLLESDLATVFFNTNDFAVSAVASRNSATVTMTVIMDQQEVRTRDSRDVLISRNITVLHVIASTYNFGSGVTTPLPIDEFVIGSRRFEARTPDGKGQCWEYSDGTSQVLKVFVEEVS